MVVGDSRMSPLTHQVYRRRILGYIITVDRITTYRADAPCEWGRGYVLWWPYFMMWWRKRR